MVLKFRVTLEGIKGFFRLYHLNADTSLYTFHKQMRAVSRMRSTVSFGIMGQSSFV